MAARRHPGVQEYEGERVLLVTRNKLSGQERCDWWPSIEEAKDSNMEVLEVRERIEVNKSPKWTGIDKWARWLLGKSGTQAHYTRERGADAMEFFESPADKKIPKRKWIKRDDE